MLCSISSKVTRLISLFKQRFEIKDLGDIEYLLGIRITRD